MCLMPPIGVLSGSLTELGVTTTNLALTSFALVFSSRQLMAIDPPFPRSASIFQSAIENNNDLTSDQSQLSPSSLLSAIDK